MGYHDPVMLKECIEHLNINPEGIYVDATFGGGGHAKEILKKLTSGRLVGFDQDADAKIEAEKISESSFTFIEANFRFLKRYLKQEGITFIDGLLADLGVSSHQIDTAARGFSTRFDGTIDMRMDVQATKSARQIINEFSEASLHRILGKYGEVRNAKTLAAAIVSARAKKPINSVADLKAILAGLAPRGKEFKYYAQVFQAIRIEVNDELQALEELLIQSEQVLKENGRLVIITYHSLEDRMVKHFVQKGKFSGEVDKDFYGNLIRPFEPVIRKPVIASKKELESNNRARSAKLRVARKM